MNGQCFYVELALLVGGVSSLFFNFIILRHDWAAQNSLAIRLIYVFPVLRYRILTSRYNVHRKLKKARSQGHMILKSLAI